MECYGGDARIRTNQDPSHYGSYQIELEAEIPGHIQPTKEALESYGFLLVDFDQWGLTCLSSVDPDLIADVDELDDYGDSTRLILRKGRLSKYDINNAMENLEQIYCRIVDEIGIPIAPPFLEAQRSVPNRLYSSETEFLQDCSNTRIGVGTDLLSKAFAARLTLHL